MNLKRKTLLRDIGCLVLAGVVIVGLYMYLTASSLHFVSDREIEINSVVDFSKFLKDVKGGDIHDVKIDSSAVNVKKIGEYQVIYKYRMKKSN